MPKKKQTIKEMLWNKYQKYYNNLLNQMEKQGYSKVYIFKQKIMYEQRQSLFKEFILSYYGDEYEVFD